MPPATDTACPRTGAQGALVAMSGGVDSAVAALLLRGEGLRCEGVTLRLLSGADGEIAAAAAVAAQLGIPHSVLDLTQDFRRCVMDPFARVYEAGGTPNPCVECNRHIKFGRLFAQAERLGLACVATGHYARVSWDAARGRWLLRKGLDAAKDQSYVLYMLTQPQLARLRLPLGGLTKAQVRALAAQQGLANAQKGDSQDICFVPDGDYVAFLRRYTGHDYPPGDFVDLAGRVVGRHSGAVCYTPGQRRGLGLAMGEPVYVCGKDMRANTVTVGPAQALYTREAWAQGMNWISLPGLAGPQRLAVRTRYHQRECMATVEPAGPDGVHVVFDEPQRAVTPGQALVLYEGDIVAGGGTLCAPPAAGEGAGA